MAQVPSPDVPAGCPYASDRPAGPVAEADVALVDFGRRLARRWWVVGLCVALGGAGAAAYAYRATPTYRANATIAPPEAKKGGAAAAALSAFGGLGAELAGSLGVSVGTTDAARLEALLESHRLLTRVVEKHDLLPVLFAERWDAASRKWRTGEPVPDVWDAERILRRAFKVSNDVKTSMLTLSFEFGAAPVTRDVLSLFLDELALLIQEDEVAKVETDRRFAEAELRRAGDPIIITKLQALLSDQVERAMTARNIRHSAFQVIDPPAGSDRPVKPDKPLVLALGSAASLVLGVVLALLLEWPRRGGGGDGAGRTP